MPWQIQMLDIRMPEQKKLFKCMYMSLIIYILHQTFSTFSYGEYTIQHTWPLIPFLYFFNTLFNKSSWKMKMKTFLCWHPWRWEFAAGFLNCCLVSNNCNLAIADWMGTAGLRPSDIKQKKKNTIHFFCLLMLSLNIS